MRHARRQHGEACAAVTRSSYYRRLLLLIVQQHLSRDRLLHPSLRVLTPFILEIRAMALIQIFCVPAFSARISWERSGENCILMFVVARDQIPISHFMIYNKVIVLFWNGGAFSFRHRTADRGAPRLGRRGIETGNLPAASLALALARWSARRAPKVANVRVSLAGDPCGSAVPSRLRETRFASQLFLKIERSILTVFP